MADKAEEKDYFETITVKWHVRYPDFIKVITDYYKKEKGLDIKAAGPIILYDYICKYGVMGPFDIVNSELGLARFFIKKNELYKIFKSYYVDHCKELDEKMDFREDHVTFYGKANYNIKNEISDQDRTPDLSGIRYNSSLGYDQLRSLITNYYEKVHKKRIVFIDVDYIIKVLKDNKDEGIIHAQTIDKEELLIKKSDVADIIEDALNRKGFKSLSKRFDEQVLMEFVEKDSKETIKETKVETKPVEEKKEKVENKTTDAEKKTVEETKISNEPQEVTNDALNALLIFEGYRIHYEILQRKRLFDEARKRKIRNAVLSGLCLLGAMASLKFKNPDTDKVLKDEANSINSWPALVEYAEDIGPLTSFLVGASAGFFFNYTKNKKLVKKYKGQIDDYLAAQNDINSLGDED